jgi:hypothetical protein
MKPIPTLKLANINNVLLEAENKNYNKLLFDFPFADIELKCLLVIDIRVLMISIKSLSLGHCVTIDAEGKIPLLLPEDFYYAIVKKIKLQYGDNKPALFWKDFDNFLLKLVVDKVCESHESELKEFIKTLKTKDINYDPDGDRPFFKTWVRNRKKHLSPQNSRKTRGRFGDFVANLCIEKNISSRWEETIQDKSLDFLNQKEVIKEIENFK